MIAIPLEITRAPVPVRTETVCIYVLYAERDVKELSGPAWECYVLSTRNSKVGHPVNRLTGFCKMHPKDFENFTGKLCIN